MQNTEKTIRLRIGDRYYSIATDDEYLRQFRPGMKNRTKNLLRSLVGRDGFEPRMTRLFKTLIKPSFTAFDIGANIGCTSILFGDLAAQAIAFEPVPRTFDLLQKNVLASGKENVKTYPFALGDENKSSEIYFSDTNRSMAFVLDRTSRDDAKTARIEVRRLDDLLSETGASSVDFVKIDVEGYELRVLRGAEATIKKYRPVVQMEFNAWTLDVQQRICLPDFLDYILTMFPLAYVVDGDSYIGVQTTAGRYEAMAQNLLHHKYKELVCAFTEDQLEGFKREYSEVTPK
jgi:FkbM family methyltransferase